MARGHADDYVLNYLAIDSALHQPVQRTGIPHREQVRTLLDDLTRTIDDVARALGIADRVQIFAIADHGSTRIPAEAPNVTDEKYFKKMALDASHRFVVATDEQLAKLPASTRAQVYVAERARFGTERNYLIARRYYRFAKTDDGFFVHGGLSPEEVIVPCARFVQARARVSPPTLRLLGDRIFRFGARADRRVEVTNVNDVALDRVRVRLQAPGLIADDVEVGTLAPREVRAVAVSGRFLKAAQPATAPSFGALGLYLVCWTELILGPGARGGASFAPYYVAGETIALMTIAVLYAVTVGRPRPAGVGWVGIVVLLGCIVLAISLPAVSPTLWFFSELLKAQVS